MDTLAKETMGLPVFICATNQQIISSGSTSHASHTSATDASSTTSSTDRSPTTSFFATATPTRSPVAPTFSSTAFSSSNSSVTSNNAERHQRRNTYTPPTFSPPERRESLLIEVLTKAADSVFGAEQGTGVQDGIWGAEDLEAGDRQKQEERKKEEKGKYQSFGDEGGFEGCWIDWGGN
ncbi:hypothetical protein E4T44_05896 [Aureobasidium sp. EXF-8845]|nr:hypothetical protein E4T44_05896 [Aureobasidium sp. EXF-8845]KAI4851285.1 hypothetical protein E4T45_05152 [Aureobasidium sp. EXF-8846]